MTAVADFLGFPKGSVAVVSGVASGIGKELAPLLLAQNVRVVGLDINQAGLDSLDFGEGFSRRRLDTADREAVNALFAELHAEFGPIGYLANNAGPPSSAPLSIEAGLAQTAGSVQIMTQAWSKAIPAQGAAVVNVASVAGAFSGGPPPAVVADRIAAAGGIGNGWYGAGKAAIAGLTRYQAVMAAGRYRACAVAPGVIETPRIGDLTEGAYGKLMIERSPLGRLGQPQEVAHAIAFLLSPAASFVNGVTLVIDGGGTLVY
ncbi:SDR family oxidoreductase [Phenylobacterium sp.]|uniref:SDR family NAD(P)-dependent oxidoreductase n=1 Tax=Phenylobacterium sp. TaxID=1871053 RepID=UPI00301BCC08